jgi:hypothetical protein
MRVWADSVTKMLAGTEDGVDELLAKFPFRPRHTGAVRLPEDQFPELHNPTMVDVIREMLHHTARTGHKLSDLLFRK